MTDLAHAALRAPFSCARALASRVGLAVGDRANVTSTCTPVEISEHHDPRSRTRETDLTFVMDSGCVGRELETYSLIHREMMRVPNGQWRLEPDARTCLVVWSSVESLLRHPPLPNQK